MKKLPAFIKRFKWLLLVVAVPVAFLLVFGWYMRGFGRALEAKAHAEYVTEFYLPEQRRLNHHWPANLDGLLGTIPVNSNGMMSDVARIHKSEFQGFEPLKSDSKNYTYIIHLRHYDVTCTARLFPKGDDGSCYDYHRK